MKGRNLTRSGRFTLFFARRMLRGRGGTARYLRGAIVGIALSLVPLIVVMEVSTGMIEGITARLLEVGTYHLQCPLPPDTPPARLDEQAAAAALVDGVIAAIPERQGTAMLVSKSGAAGVSIRCVPPDVFSRDKGFSSYVTITAGSADLGGSSMLLSSALASSLGVAQGETINVLTTWSGDMSGPPRLTPLRVSGIYETGYQELDRTLVYTSLAVGSRILSPRASRTMIGVKVRDPFGNLAPIEGELAATLGGSVRVMAWNEIEYARLASFRTTKALLLFIMALIVIVASVNVSSSVLMIVFERKLDIGILKSVGAAPRPLTQAFLATGFLTGLLGTAGGIVAGLLVAVNINQVIAGIEWIVNRFLALASLLRSGFDPSFPAFGAFTLFNSAYYLKSIPVRISAGEVIAAAVAAILLSALASWLPAARAARTSPLEILRKV
ncbi:MAG: FtsX-like permease family protein [Spirochaetia bacterium]